MRSVPKKMGSMLAQRAFDLGDDAGATAAAEVVDAGVAGGVGLVEVAAVFGEEVQDFPLAGCGSGSDGGEAVIVEMIDVGTTLQEEFDSGEMSGAGGDLKWGIAEATIFDEIHGDTLIEQGAGSLQVTDTG